MATPVGDVQLLISLFRGITSIAAQLVVTTMYPLDIGGGTDWLVRTVNLPTDRRR